MAELRLQLPCDVRLLEEGVGAGAVLGAFDDATAGSGAVVSFTGKVRPDQAVQALELTHYEPLTLPGMVSLAEEAFARWPLDALLAWHRTGTMRPGEPVVLVAAAAPHRREAFEAVDYVMDCLKTKAWFWKRERRADVWHWIEPRPRDHTDAQRWTQPDR